MVSKNLTTDTKRERIHVFNGGQADAFENIPFIRSTSFVSPVSRSSFEELRRAIASKERRSIRRFAMLTEKLSSRVRESFGIRKNFFRTEN